MIETILENSNMKRKDLIVRLNIYLKTLQISAPKDPFLKDRQQFISFISANSK